MTGSWQFSVWATNQWITAASDIETVSLLADLAWDISERKRAETALQAASAYNRSLIEASLDPLVTISTEGKITDVNAATEKVTGFSRNELIGSDFSDYFTDPEKARAGYQQVFRDGSVTDYELVISHKDGSFTSVMYNASLYQDESGKIIGVFAAARDISDRKKAEEALRASEARHVVELEQRIRERTSELVVTNEQLINEINERKQVESELQRSNTELQQFAYVASHDLQEPLRMISSYVQLLERRYKDKLDEDADEFIAYAVDGAKRMQGLITDLLELSRLGTRERSLGAVDCEAILKQALGNLQASLAECCAQVTHEPLPTVTADATQLVQLFQNLIGNAVKFRGTETQTHTCFCRTKERQVAVLCPRQRYWNRSGALRPYIRNLPAPAWERGISWNRNRFGDLQEDR